MNKIIQLQPWRDLLLALTEHGEIYQLSIDPLPMRATLLFPGGAPALDR